MAESSPSFPVTREAVASFPDRQHFHRAVADLLAAGFETADLSVLASHDSLAAAGEPDIVEKVRKGYKAGKKTFKVYLEGYNLLPIFKGEVKENTAPKEPFFPGALPRKTVREFCSR